MPEGDTIYKTAAALRPYLQDQTLVAARSGPRFPRLDALVGARVIAIEPRGKHLIMHCDNGLALHTHLRMTGSWHRYAPGQPWQKPASRASVVLEVPHSVLVCFSAPIVDLLQEGAMDRHRGIGSLGPDLLAETFDRESALLRLRSPERAMMSIAEALLDQRAFAGVGNEYKSEILFIHRVDPWTFVADLADDTLRAILETCERLLRANVVPGRTGRWTTDASPLARGSRVWVYGRRGKPCFRCGTRIESRLQGEQARITFWCPRCQVPADSPPSSLMSTRPATGAPRTAHP
ncbi:MAG: Fpg/Nei family DNA glycosylase [Chloroflexi bacterium]|nr:Fpg/Nei family DNA glycosylase [Chloroflexota bacterium]